MSLYSLASIHGRKVGGIYSLNLFMSPLEKSTRRKIFYALVGLFLLIAPAVVLYSRGYVIDFRSRKIVVTGGIFVKTAQSGAKVFLDRNLEKETSFISRGTLITGLAPGRYTVEVTKDGYQPWIKVVRVQNEEVAEYRNIVLPPVSLNPASLFTFPTNSLARLELFNSNTELGVEALAASNRAIFTVVNPLRAGSSPSIRNVVKWQWDRLGSQLYVGREVSKKIRWYRVAVNADGTITQTAVSFRGLPSGFSPEEVTPHPTAPGQFYFLAGGALFLQTSASVPVPIAQEVHAYTVTPDSIYFVTQNGFFVQTDLAGKNTTLLGRKGLFLDPANPARFVVSSSGQVAVIDSAGGLFLYRPAVDSELQLVATNVKDADFDAAGDEMLYWDKNHIWLYWVEDNRRQPFQVSGSRDRIFESADEIRRAVLDDDGTYFFYATNRELGMVETDNRGGPNAYILREGSISDFALDKDTLVLYWADGNKIFRASLK